jgi:hypothetical protein
MKLPVILMLSTSTPPVPEIHWDSPVATGLVCYAAGMVSLTLLESLANKYDLPSTFPTSPNTFTKEEKQLAFTTPLTADRALPPPRLKTLKKRSVPVSRHSFGDCNIVQSIACVNDDFHNITDIQTVSPEWSHYYGTKICIIKIKM